MSTTTKWVIAIVVVVLALAAIAWLTRLPGQKPDNYQGAQNAAPNGETAAAAVAGRDNSDASLTADLQQVDGQLNQVSADATASAEDTSLLLN